MITVSDAAATMFPNVKATCVWQVWRSPRLEGELRQEAAVELGPISPDAVGTAYAHPPTAPPSVPPLAPLGALHQDPSRSSLSGWKVAIGPTAQQVVYRVFDMLTQQVIEQIPDDPLLCTNAYLRTSKDTFGELGAHADLMS